MYLLSEMTMSRSMYKTKKRGITTATSEKMEKQKANRKFRRITREQVKKGIEALPVIREISDVWVFSKDGKIYDCQMTGIELKK